MAVCGFLLLRGQQIHFKPGLWNKLASVDQKSNKGFMKTVTTTAETHVQK